MGAMANTTPIVTTVTKPTTKEKTPREADATPRVNIQDFCEEHYEDILPVIIDNIRGDKRKEVHARLDFEESPKKRRIREGSQNSSARTLSTRARSTNSVILTRQAQLSPDRTEQIPEIILAVEAALTGGALLAEIVLGAGTALVSRDLLLPAAVRRIQIQVRYTARIGLVLLKRKYGTDWDTETACNRNRSLSVKKGEKETISL
ncbi:hypothetical protein Tco_1367800 [Tanacetum coccineum]